MESKENFEIRTWGESARLFAGYKTWDVVGTFSTYDEAKAFAYKMALAGGFVIRYALTTTFNDYCELVC